MAKLDELCHRIVGYAPRGRAAASPAAPAASSGGGFFGMFGGGSKPAAPVKEPAPLKPTGPRGLYLWGGTGTGKTFMMDIFHEAAPVEKKRRIHFHEWMIDVNERLNRLQKNRRADKDASADDLVAQVAEEMLGEAWLLCFDEFQVTHISDAIIMKRIFSVMFERGAVIVATSNRPPEDLYLNGLNRPLFTPFIPMLKDFCEVHDIGAEVDYRLISSADGEDDLRVYICPNGEEEKALLERKWERLSRGGAVTNLQLEAQGRKLGVPRAATGSQVAWFNFKDLCDRPLGAADYLAVAAAFHTVFIADVPKLTLQERDQVRRFIVLIDALYDHQTKVICTADLDPIPLFEFSDAERRDGTFDEIFAWDRTVSRLTEMQSTKYLSEAARSMVGSEFLNQFNVRSLSDEDTKEMWMRYDRDDSGELDMDELRLMLEDLMEKQRGHRNLTNDAFDACASTIDLNKDGKVSYEEFETYLKDFSLVSSSLRVDGSATDIAH